jgi:hypothetical protein
MKGATGGSGDSVVGGEPRSISLSPSRTVESSSTSGTASGVGMRPAVVPDAKDWGESGVCPPKVY